MKRDQFEAAVMDEFDKICDLVEQQDAELFKAEENAEAYRKHLSAIGAMYCDVCHGAGQGASPPKPENWSVTYAFELHMRDVHDANFAPGPDPQDPYTAQDWRMLAETLWSSGWRIVKHPDGSRAHLNNGRGVSYGDVVDNDDNVILSSEQQVAMVEQLGVSTGWFTTKPEPVQALLQQPVYNPPM